MRSGSRSISVFWILTPNQFFEAFSLQTIVYMILALENR